MRAINDRPYGRVCIPRRNAPPLDKPKSLSFAAGLGIAKVFGANGTAGGIFIEITKARGSPSPRMVKRIMRTER